MEILHLGMLLPERQVIDLQVVGVEEWKQEQWSGQLATISRGAGLRDKQEYWAKGQEDRVVTDEIFKELNLKKSEF